MADLKIPYSTVPGQIIRSISGFYDVQTKQGVVRCRARGYFRKETHLLTGDQVRISLNDDGTGIVQVLYPRRNYFVRPAVANLDQLVIFASVVNPVTDLFLIDRVAAIAAEKGVRPILCLNKADLDPGENVMDIYRLAHIPVTRISAVTGEGIGELWGVLWGKVSAFTGNSGVGKSSTLNALRPDLGLATGEVSEKLGRGRHTTRCVELYDLGDHTYVMDTPGFSAFDTDRVDTLVKEHLDRTFPEFAPYLGCCQYADCTHRQEPGCAVRKGIDYGYIAPSRYQSYLRLYDMASQKKSWE